MGLLDSDFLSQLQSLQPQDSQPQALASMAPPVQPAPQSSYGGGLAGLLGAISAGGSGADSLQKYQSGQLGLQQQQSTLAKLAEMRQQGITNPGQILAGLATVNPDYTEKATAIAAQYPLGYMMGQQNGQPAPAPSSGVAAPAAPDPYALQPESPDDKRDYNFLNSKVPGFLRADVRAMSNGDDSVGNGDSTRSTMLHQLAYNFDHSMSKTNYTARVATAKAFSQGGKAGQFITSANTGTKHLAQVALDALDLHNSNNIVGNWIGNLFSQASGADPVTNFNSDVTTVAPELDKASSGGNDTTVEGTKAQRAAFGTSGSPEQLLGTIAGKATLIQSKADEIGNSYKQDMSRSKQIISPDNQQTLQDLKDLHNFAKQDKLNDPKAQAIVTRLRSVVGQQPAATPVQRVTTQADIVATAQKTGKSIAQVTQDATAKGYKIQ